MHIYNGIEGHVIIMEILLKTRPIRIGASEVVTIEINENVLWHAERNL
jgi:hypothetical protein